MLKNLLAMYAPGRENVIWNLLVREVLGRRRASKLLWIVAVALPVALALMRFAKPEYATLVCNVVAIASVLLFRELVRPAVKFRLAAIRMNIAEQLATMPVPSAEYAAAFLRLLLIASVLVVINVTMLVLMIFVIERTPFAYSESFYQSVVGVNVFVLLFGWSLYWPAVVGGRGWLLAFIAVLTSPFTLVFSIVFGTTIQNTTGILILAGMLAAAAGGYITCRRSYRERLLLR